MLVVTEEAYPLSYTEKGDNEVKGLATNFVKELLLKANIEYEIKILPWSRAYKMAVEHENVLIYSIAKTSARNEKFYWIGNILNLNYHLFSLSSRKHDIVPKVANNYKNNSIGVISDSASHQHLKYLNYSNLIPVQNTDQLFEILKKKRVDLLLGSMLGINYFVKRNQLSKDYFHRVHTFHNLEVKLYIAVSKKTDEKLVLRLKEAFDSLKDQDSFKQLSTLI